MIGKAYLSASTVLINPTVEDRGSNLPSHVGQGSHSIGQTHPRAHRKDIDGLRAVAVLLVILFHTGVKTFSGGFVGVDIFFVISGFLITGIIAREMSRGSFSIINFYERRIRRIVPALTAMLLACSLAAYLLLLPSDLLHFGHALLAAVLSCANIYFWTQDSYFKPAYGKALLHTWSLGVEEQFYLLFPLTLMILGRRRKSVIWGVVLLTLLSFGTSEWLVLTHRASTAFYMPFSRAWELFVGSLLALNLIKFPAGRKLREVLALVGVLLIVFGAVHFDSETAFPGVAAMLPCFGAALLIGTGSAGPTIFSRLLSRRPFTFIGLISYSVYLWHWPLITFAKMGVIRGLSDKGAFRKAVVLLASLAFGWLSWRFVEQPLREGSQWKLSASRVYGLLAGCSGLAIAFGLMCMLNGGFPQRFPPLAVKIGDYLETEQQMQIGKCFITSTNHFSDFDANGCVSEDPSRRNYLLVGDSHAAALWFGLDQTFKQSHIMEATASNCDPTVTHYDTSDCGKMRRYVFESLLPRLHVEGVILTERWQSPHDIEDIQPTVAWLKSRGIPVILVGPVQEYDAPLPILLALSIKRDEPDLPRQHLVPGIHALDRLLRSSASAWHVQYFSPWQTFCGDGACQEFADDAKQVPMLSDSNHLTNVASLRMSQSWMRAGLLK